MQELLKSKKEWDAIDFGGINMEKKEPKPVTESLVQYGYTFQAHCILYKRTGIEKVKEIDATKNAITFDECLPGLRNVHPREDINKLYELSPLIVYHSSLRLSSQRKEDIHDTERHNVRSWSIPPTIESFDMKNYYKFSNVSDPLSRLAKLLTKANDEMWKFQLDSCVEDVDTRPYVWMLPVDETKKVTVLVHPEALWIHQNKKQLKIDCKPKSVYSFPPT